MAKLDLSSLLIITTVLIVSATSSIATSDFIETSCKATRYPPLCIECLSAYANTIKQSEHKLTHTALEISLARVKSAATFVSKMVKSKGIKPKEYRAVIDCAENMGNSVDRLNESVKEFTHMGGDFEKEEFIWRMSNVQTWVSSALTDAETCLDGFEGRSMNGNVKVKVRKRVVNVSQVTSNGLALVNRFVSRRKEADVAEKH